MARIALFAAIVALAYTAPVNAQVSWDSDFGGYSQQIGGTTYHHRGGTTSTYRHIGNLDFYSSSNGTTGTSLYSSAGRFDSYSNPSQGWAGSGYIPYYGGASTYRRYPTYTPSYTPTYTPTYSLPAYNWNTWGSAPAPVYRSRYRSSWAD